MTDFKASQRYYYLTRCSPLLALLHKLGMKSVQTYYWVSYEWVDDQGNILIAYDKTDVRKV